jgi:hypothetical protein
METRAGLGAGQDEEVDAGMSAAEMTDERVAEIKAGWANDDEAHALLDLINAEFQSDPLSTQCFDLRIVQRVSQCVAKRKKLKVLSL